MLQLSLAFYVVFPVCSVFFWVICAEQYFWKLLEAGIKHRSFGSLSMGLNPLTFTKKKKKKAGPSVTSSTCRNGVWLTIEFWWARCTQCREGNLNKMHLWLLSLPRALNQNHRAKTMNVQKLHLHSDWNCSWTNRTFELSAYFQRQLIYVLLWNRQVEEPLDWSLSLRVVNT